MSGRAVELLSLLRQSDRSALRRRVRYYSFWPWHQINYVRKRLIDRYLTPRVQERLPVVRRRIKIAPAAKLSVVVSSGNRLNSLKRTLDSYLQQDTWAAYEVAVSIYADREGTAAYVRRHYETALSSGRLRLIETPARIFNKARALNIAVRQVDSPFLLLIDCDCAFTAPTALSAILNQYNAHPYDLVSFSYQGQILVRRDEYVALGGFDGSLQDLWCPDDADFITRYVAYYGKPWLQLGDLGFTRLVTIESGQPRAIQRLTKNPRWIRQVDLRQRHVTEDVRFRNRFFERIGGWRGQSDNEVLEHQVAYFQKHSPRLPYLTEEDGPM